MRADRRRHRVADIAAQSGLSRATVDRVLHGRDGVRPETVAQVDRAIDELERQQGQVHLSSRPLILDLVMQAPDRFASQCRAALERELHALRPAVVRARSHLREQPDPAAAADALGAIERRGSAGVHSQGPRPPRGARGGGAARRPGDRHGHVRHRSPGQSPSGVRRRGQLRGRGDGGVPGHVSGPRARASAGDRQPLDLPGRGGAGDRFPDRRSPRWHRTGGRAVGDRHRRAWTRSMLETVRAELARSPVDRRGLLRRRRERGHAERVRGARFPSRGVHRPRSRRRQPALLRTRRISAVLHHDLTPTCAGPAGSSSRLGACCRAAR